MKDAAPESLPGPAPRSARRSALTLMGGTLGSRVTGFVRQSLITQLFPPALTDAFFVALRVPNLFRELLAEGALTNAFVPRYRALAPGEAKRLAAALLGLLLVANGLLLLLAYAALPSIVDLLLLGQGSVDRDLTLRLTRIVFPFLFAVSLSAWAMGILNAEERFFWPAWAPVALNVVSILVILAYPGQAGALAWGFVAGGVAQFAVQLPALWRAGLFAGVRLWHPALAGVLLLMVPSAFTTSGRQLLNLVSANVLNLLPPGSVTAFQNAELFLSLALGLFSISPALAYYTRLSGEAADAPEAFAGTLLEGLRFIAFLTAPAGLLLLVLSAPATQVIFNWLPLLGRPGADAAVLTATAWAAAPLGLAIFPLGLINLLLRTFYIREQVRLLVGISVAALLVQGGLYLLLYRPLGIAGLSWATVLVGWGQFAVLLGIVARREGLALPVFLRHALRLWLAGLVAAGVALGVVWGLPWGGTWWAQAARVALGGAAFLGVYGGLCAALGVPEAGRFLGRLRRKP